MLSKSSFPHFSTVIHLPNMLKSVKIKTRGGRVLLSQEEVRFEIHTNMHKPVVPDNRNILLHLIQGASWTPEGRMQCPSHSPSHLMTQVTSLVVGQKKMMHPLLKRLERRSPGTTDCRTQIYTFLSTSRSGDSATSLDSLFHALASHYYIYSSFEKGIPDVTVSFLFLGI